MEAMRSIQLVSKEDLEKVKHIIKHWGGGIKKFSKDIGIPYCTVKNTLSGKIHNPFVLTKAFDYAIEVASPINERVSKIKSMDQFLKAS